VVSLGALLVAVAPLVGQSTAPQIESIRMADLKADVFFLASDEMRGRLANSPENRLAAGFIRSRFERSGLKPAGTNRSYFQVFQLTNFKLGADNRLTVAARGREVAAGQLGEDFFPESFSATGTVEGGVVYVGFGITAPALNHDDYRAADARGKVALVLNHEPGESDPHSPFDGEVASEFARPLRKALYAQQHGARAVLFVTDIHNHPDRRSLKGAMRTEWPAEPQRLEGAALTDWVDQVRIPVVQVSPEFADRLLQPAGKRLSDVAQQAEAGGGVTPVPLAGVEVRVAAAIERTPLDVQNVLGLVEGSDPLLKNDWVIVSAHFDHTGAEATRTFNGADDNASGVAGVLEVAEAYARAESQGFRPRRSILLAGWNAEERGLLGAWAFTERPPVPLERVIAVLNMDMIGRDEEVPADGGTRFTGLDPQTAASNHNAVNVMGYSRSSDLRQATELANRSIGLDLRFRYDNNRSNLLRRSDQWPFLFRGVPAIFLHTGLHPDYHTERDRPEKLNYEKMERIVRLVYQMSWNLADAPERPRVNP